MKSFRITPIGYLLIVLLAACDTEDRPFDEDTGNISSTVGSALISWGPAAGALRHELGKPLNTIEPELTDEELATVTRLRLGRQTSPGTLDDYDIALLLRCINLKELYLDGMFIEAEHLRWLAVLPALESLGLSQTHLRDLTPLADFVNLRHLDLRVNQISDIGPLAGLTNLRVLDLESNEIADITPLSGLIRLQALNLNRNRIVDLKPLVDNPGLTNAVPAYRVGFFERLPDVVSVWDNPLSEVSRTEHIPALRARRVIVCQ